MRTADLFGSVRSVLAHKLRTALTLLGIIIGTGSIVMLAGLIRSAEEALVRTSQQATDADLVQIVRDDPPEKQRNKTRRDLSRADETTLRESELLAGARVGAEVGHASEAHHKDQKRAVTIVGGFPQALGVYRLTVKQGRFLLDDDVDERARVAVIGWEVHRDLGEPSLGDAEHPLVIEADGHLWKVIGILEKKPILGSTTSTHIWDRKVLVPASTYDAIFAPSHKVTSIQVRKSESLFPMSELRAIVQKTLLRRHLGVSDFKLRDASDKGQEQLILSVIKLLLLSTGLLALFVGGINIMNVMLVTVTERTREIGIRRAVGATPRLIVLQFLMEASLVSLMGGVIGVVLGVGISFLASVGLRALLGRWDMHVELWSIAAGLSLSLVTGIVFGLLPARRAARIRPMDALRFE